MSRRWIIAPEVAGQLGSDTVLDPSTHPPRVQRLHYEFDGWLGDDLVESFPCFVVTERLASALRQSSLTGWAIDTLLVSKSDTFQELYPDRELPPFAWLVVRGESDDDFHLTTEARLDVSDEAMKLLRAHSLENALIEPR